MKAHYGKSFEITQQLSSNAAITIAQWIGGYTVIKNQKTLISQDNYNHWLNNGKKENERPVNDQKVAFLNQQLPFLKDLPSQIRRNAGSKWFESMTAAMKGIRKAPTVKPKHKKRNCLVTQELFTVQSLNEHSCVVHLKEHDKQKNKLLTGFTIPFSKEQISNSFYLSRQGNRFWFSISYDTELDVLSVDEVKEKIVSLSDKELQLMARGYDCGVKKQVYSSSGDIYHFTKDCQNKLNRLDNKITRFQRIYARIARANDRQIILTENKTKSEKTKQTIAFKFRSVKRNRTEHEKRLLAKIAKYQNKKAAIKKDTSHKISKKIVDSTPLIAVFEKLNLKGMTARPKAKPDPDNPGRWLKNGAKAKSALNKSLLSVNIGQIVQFTRYKLTYQGKYFLQVAPHHTSQECSNCHHIDKKNRQSQSEFCCVKCNHKINADHNASINIKYKGIRFIRSEMFLQKKTPQKISLSKAKQAKEQSSLNSGYRNVISGACHLVNPSDGINHSKKVA